MNEEISQILNQPLKEMQTQKENLGKQMQQSTAYVVRSTFSQTPQRLNTKTLTNTRTLPIRFNAMKDESPLRYLLVFPLS